MNQRKDILAIDVGSGTQDILVRQGRSNMENSPKMVLPSATTLLAKRIDRAREERRHIFLTGVTMGGGPSSAAVRRHLGAGLRVFALREPALTFHDNLTKVEKMGVEIVEERPSLEPVTELPMGDIDLHAIREALHLFGVEMPEFVAVAVQDHGYAPEKSNRAFRFEQWKELLGSGRGLETLLYPSPPDHFTRMKAVARISPGAWIMDTGPTAVLGALLDPWVAERSEEGVTVVNVGNEHTVAALIKGSKTWGIYEHHTSLVNPGKLKDHLDRFRREELTNEEIFEEMGHGCLVLPGAGSATSFRHVTVTGPNRDRFNGLGAHMAAPFGDMMLTGCFGLVEAVDRALEKSEQRGGK
jgi:uncharacterized protein (DUF1786 family)